MIQAGELGRIQYIYSSRLNLGKLRTEENILWSFAPHDISAILFLLGETPSRVSSHGGTYLNDGIMDTTLTNCDFKSGVKAHIFVSWLHPFKEQKLAIIGDQMMAVFDDTQSERKLVLYSHRISWVDRVPVAEKADAQVVALSNEEPLRRECEHFLECVGTRKTPRTSGESALHVLEVLEACETSARQNGIPVEVSRKAVDFHAHSSAVIDAWLPDRSGYQNLALLARHERIQAGQRLQPGTERGDQPRGHHREQCENSKQCFRVHRSGTRRRRILRTLDGVHQRDQSAQPCQP